MNSRNWIHAPVLPALLTLSLCAAAANGWQQVGESEFGKVSVKTSSIQKQGDGLGVTYRLDFPMPQQNTRGGKNYLSTEIRAVVFCSRGEIARYELTAYSEKEGAGEVVGGFKQSLVETPAQQIGSGGTDEDVWRFLCANKSVPVKK